jgi:hypothetical protein
LRPTTITSPRWSPRGDEDEAGGEAAEDRSHGVDGVDRADGGALEARASPTDLDGEGQGNPHQDGGRDHDDRGLGERERVGLAGEERALKEAEEEGRRPGPEPDAELEAREQQHRPAGRGEEARVDEAPQGDPGQEGREHGGEREDVVVQEQVEHPRPQELVGQGAEPGEPCPHEDGSGREAVVCRRRRLSLARLRRGGFLLFPPGCGEEPRRHGDAEVQGHGQPGRAAHPQEAEQDVPRGEAADHRAGGVQAVEEAGLVPEAPPAGAEPLQQDRERSSHEERGRENETEADRESDQVEEGHVALQAKVESRVDRRRPGEQQGEHEGESPDAGFEQRVEPHERPRPGVDEAPEHEAAGGQPRHVGGHHRAGREQGIPENQHQQAGPDDLVDEARDPREEEEEQHRDAAAVSRASRVSRWVRHRHLKARA